MRRTFRPSLTALLLALAFAPLEATAAEKEARAAEQQKLAALQPYVGDWKGVGQPKRGSTAGAWTEESVWAWSFKDEHARVAFQAADGKYFSGGWIEPGADADSLVLKAVPAGEKPADDATAVVYRGAVGADGQVVFNIDQPAEGRPDRITTRLVAENKRMLILYEKRLGDTDRYTRLAEVGYTRKGSGFGGGATFPECVVTGGYADREVEYMGKKYKICCEGCRDLFLQDPEGVLADYKARKEQERAKGQ